MSSFNIHQQVFILGMASGIATGCVGKQSDLQKKTSDALQPTIDKMNIGNWKVVWGPNVWKADPTDTSGAADHTWYIAHNSAANFEDGQSHDTYVISITGTATNSNINAHEDIDVGVVVDFNQWLEFGLPTFPIITSEVDATKPYIAYGTASGVHRILNIPTSDGVTLSKFLRTIPATSRIIFTGHSLGGVLSPTVALAAVKAGDINAPQSNTFTYPIAGPSPGNGPFADLYAGTFPRIDIGDSAYKSWNTVIWNMYDIVPHAWNTGSVPGQNLLNIIQLYGQLPKDLNDTVSKAVGAVVLVLVLSGVPKYVPLQGSRITPSSVPAIPQTWDEFLATAGYQHVYGYYDAIGTPVVPTLCDPPPAKQLPVIGNLDKAKKKAEKDEGARKVDA